ncbi:MAG: GGDEF domain-containing protein [Ilumatobacteraceae bacterium]
MIERAGDDDLDVVRSLATQAALVLEARRLGTMWDGLRSRSAEDPLLGLPTEVALDERIHAATEPLALVYVSLSGTETINDLYGFSVGDRLLRAAAAGSPISLGPRTSSHAPEATSSPS